MADTKTQDATVPPATETVPVPLPEPAAAATSAAAAAPPAPEPAPAAPVPAPDTEVPEKPAEPTPPAVAETPVPVPPAEPTPAPGAAEAVPSKEEPKELQNALTEKFTEPEWVALKEFRSQLGDAFAEAYPDKADAKTAAITLWGVTLDPAVPSARASVVLVKFLRARNLNVREARSMFVSTLRWRATFDIEKALTEEFPEDIFGKLGHVYGKDKGGRPITYNLYGANQDLKAVFGDTDRFIRWRVKLMEQGIAKLDFETVDQMIQIHDYEGVTLSSRDAHSKRAASEATNIFQSHYPELLYKKFFVNVPTLLAWIFWLFKPLVSAQTLAKMSVVGHGASTIGRELLPLIDKDQLPKRYGGETDAF